MAESSEGKKPRRANLRKKQADNADDDDDDDIRARLEETKREQKFRARGAGVDAETLLVAGKAKGHNEGIPQEAIQGKESLLDSQFSAENEGQASYTLMEQHMMDYIDKKMAKDDGSKPAQRAMTAEDELYMIPDHLKVQHKELNIENGAETWLTGIVEVELPMDEKLRNIEETERAKKKMLEDRQRGVMSSGFRVDTSSDKGYMRMDQKAKKKGQKKEEKNEVISEVSKRLLALPAQTNFNANFVQHRPTREIKESASSTSGGPASAVPRRNEMSSDDIVMERFRKRFRR